MLGKAAPWCPAAACAASPLHWTEPFSATANAFRWSPKPQPSTRPTSQDKGTGQSNYLIAFKDETIQEATAVWKDRLMLHYTTPQGGHEQVRLDRVDWKLSEQLNRERKEAGPVRPVQAGLPR